MINRLLVLLQSMLCSAWIAGYIAIVLPVIVKRMLPGQQNGNFSFWADAGWVFFILIALFSAYFCFQAFTQKRMVVAFGFVALSIAIAVFQAFGSSDTYAVIQAADERNKTHENTKFYKKADAELQRAHKSSERNISLLMLCLLGQIALSFVFTELPKPDKNEE